MGDFLLKIGAFLFKSSGHTAVKRYCNVKITLIDVTGDVAVDFPVPAAILDPEVRVISFGVEPPEADIVMGLLGL